MTRPLSPQRAAVVADPVAVRATILAEKARRSGSRSFAAFVKQAWPHFDPAPLQWNWHHEALCTHMQEFAYLRIKRLRMHMPPRSGKSNIISIAWPAWVWTFKPNAAFVFVSYAASLATEHSIKCRSLLEGDWYRKTYRPAWSMRDDQNIKSDFMSTVGGRRMATSITGRVIGFGGDYVVFDDPLNAEDAHSEATIKETNRVVTTIVNTRLNSPENGAVALNMQRLSPDDPSTMFPDAENFTIPMEFVPARRAVTYHFLNGERKELWRDPRNDHGELLFAERWSRELVDKLKLPPFGAHAYAAQFQQEPESFEGGMFRRVDWRFYARDDRGGEAPNWTNLRPAGCDLASRAVPLPMRFDRVIMTVDCAFKDNPSGSRVAIHVWGRAGADRFLLARRTEHMDFVATKQAIREVARDWPLAVEKYIEDAANGPAIIAELRHEIGGLIPVRADGSKEARAAAAQPYQRSTNCYLPEGAPWLDEFVQLFAAFPKGKDKDDVDAFAHAMRKLEEQPEAEVGRINWGRR